MTTHEDLALLFEQHLSLQPNPVYVSPQQEPRREEPILYSISQHYHHSAHVVNQQPSRPASEPPQTDMLTTEIILSRHGVDVSALYPSQIELFQTADANQKMRLVELWRICRPDYSGNDPTQDLWTFKTTFQQEVSRAKLQYERKICEERMSRAAGDQGMDSDTMSDSSTTAPLTPIQGGDGRWSQNAEPYMLSGYETLARRDYERSAAEQNAYSHFGTAVEAAKYTHATDPVYKSVDHNSGSWQALLSQTQQAMENQYGTYAQHFHHNMAGVTVACRQGEDEEML